MNLKHWFLPHPETHRRAHLISSWAIACYILVFILLQSSLDLIGQFKPGVLGISSNIDQKTLIDLTNQEREKLGLADLKENQELDAAALAKAQNMFAENYWAHYSPSGKDPWGFIQGAGYHFSYAGENLARNFYQSNDVVAAWMASPSHKANIINSHYQEIGIAVLQGTLQGQQTTLVVQEFGAPTEALAKSLPPQVTNQVPSQVELSTNTLGTPSSNSKILVDPYVVTKTFGLSLITLLIILIGLDLYIIRKRAVHRITSRHLPHLALLSLSAISLINMKPGII